MCAGISLPKYSAISLHILVFRIARQDHFLASERLASCVGLLRLALLNRFCNYINYRNDSSGDDIRVDIRRMSAIKEQSDLASFWAGRCKAIFGKKQIDAEERIEIETLCAIAIELMKSATPSKLREAARNVELRHYLRDRE